jgi:hypothetical protein
VDKTSLISLIKYWLKLASYFNGHIFLCVLKRTSLTLRARHRPEVFENRARRRIFGSKIQDTA